MSNVRRLMDAEDRSIDNELANKREMFSVPFARRSKLTLTICEDRVERVLEVLNDFEHAEDLYTRVVLPDGCPVTEEEDKYQWPTAIMQARVDAALWLRGQPGRFTVSEEPTANVIRTGGFAASIPSPPASSAEREGSAGSKLGKDDEAVMCRVGGKSRILLILGEERVQRTLFLYSDFPFDTSNPYTLIPLPDGVPVSDYEAHHQKAVAAMQARKDAERFLDNRPLEFALRAVSSSNAVQTSSPPPTTAEPPKVRQKPQRPQPAPERAPRVPTEPEPAARPAPESARPTQPKHGKGKTQYVGRVDYHGVRSFSGKSGSYDCYALGLVLESGDPLVLKGQILAEKCGFLNLQAGEKVRVKDFGRQRFEGDSGKTLYRNNYWIERIE